MTARDRIVIVIVIVVAAIVGSWLMVIQPKRDRAAKLGAQVTSARSQLDAARAELAQARLAQSAYRAASAQLARLGEAVPPDEQVPSLIYQLQSAANGARIDFRGLQTAASSSSTASSSSASQSSSVSAGSNGFPTQQFTFTFIGTYTQLSRFINHVQHFVTVKGEKVSVRGRLLALQSISLAAAPSGFPNVTATISASAYVMPSSQSPTSSTTPSTPSTTTSSPTASTNSSPASAAPAAVATPIR
jgi:type II secretory pathway pseudopilin PulG